MLRVVSHLTSSFAQGSNPYYIKLQVANTRCGGSKCMLPGLGFCLACAMDMWGCAHACSPPPAKLCLSPVAFICQSFSTFETHVCRVPAVSAQLLVNGVFVDMQKSTGPRRACTRLPGHNPWLLRDHAQAAGTWMSHKPCSGVFLFPAAADNYFLLTSGGPFAFPTDVRVTSILGDTVRDRVQSSDPSNTALITGAAQFPLRPEYDVVVSGGGSTTGQPTSSPTSSPTLSPTPATPTASPMVSTPTAAPTVSPTRASASTPTAAPTSAPSRAPTAAPMATPNRAPTAAPFSGGSCTLQIGPYGAPRLCWSTTSKYQVTLLNAKMLGCNTASGPATRLSPP